MAKNTRKEALAQAEPDDNHLSGPSEPFTVNIDDLEGEGAGDDKGGKKKDDRSAEHADADGGDEQDSGLGAHGDDAGDDEGNDSNQESVRERRRQERADRKARREAKDRELETLRATVGNLERGQQQINQQKVIKDLEECDSYIARAQSQYAEATEAKKKAAAANNGEALVAADEAIFAARESFSQASNRKASILESVERSRTQARPQMNPVVREQGSAFVKDNPWYKPDGSDRDSAKTLAIDKQMEREGWNPNTVGYWEELRSRVKKELPHRYGKTNGKDINAGDEGDDDDDGDMQERKPQRQTTGGSGRDSGGGGSGRTYTLSAARVHALKEAGMWEDPKERMKMINKYRQADEKARAERRNNT